MSRVRGARGLVAVGVVALAASCGGTSDDEEPSRAESSASATPAALSAERLVEALPEEDALPDDAVVKVRCPGDPPCTEDPRQDQTASVSMNLPLPDGVQHDTTSSGDRARYVVAGGEYEENLWLRSWYSDDAAAERGLARASEGLDRMQGELDTPPEQTDTGYTYGIRGRGTVEDLGIDGWEGFVRILDARFVHLDGRVSDPRYDIVAVARRGPVVVRVDASFTSQGREQADAERVVREQLDGYVGDLTGDGGS